MNQKQITLRMAIWNVSKDKKTDKGNNGSATHQENSARAGGLQMAL